MCIPNDNPAPAVTDQPPPLVSGTPYRVGILANRDHCITRLTLQRFLENDIVPVFVIEDEGTQKMRDKTAWYNGVYEKKRRRLPSITELLEPVKSLTVHHTVKNINGADCIEFMKQHPVDILVLANTRIVKPVVLSVPAITTMNAHAAFLPNHDPAHVSPSPGGYMRGAMPFIFAIPRNEPIAVTVHHVLEELDAGMIVDSMRIPVKRYDTMEDVMCGVVDVSADLWLRALLRWDGTTKGVPQDVSLLTEENKTAVRGLAGNDLAEAMKEGDEMLATADYKWFTV